MSGSFPADELERVLSHILRLTGIRLPDTMYAPVIEYLEGKTGDSSRSVQSYLTALESDRDEFDRFVDRITIGETYFFRDERQFRIFDERLFPEFRKQGRSSLRLWSAACSTGEEAVSLAAIASLHCANRSFEDYTVFATDLNRASVESLKRGSFKAGSLRPDGAAYHALLEPFLSRPDPLTLSVSSAATDRIVASCLDLSSLDYWTIPDELDLILIRNVLIYLDPALRNDILAALLRKLRVHGCLFLAASEAPLFSHPELALRDIDGVYFLERVPARRVQRGSHQAKPQGAAFAAAKANVLSSAKAGAPAIPKPTAAASAVTSPAAHPAPRAAAKPMAEKVLVGETFPSAEKDLVRESPLGRAAPHHGDGEPVFRRCFELINANETAEARDLLAAAGEKSGTGFRAAPTALFLDGYSHLCDGNTAKALDAFSRCLSVEPNFWPARYHRGILRSHTDGESARRDFVQARIDIERYLRDGLSSYDFLLEGFNGRYFMDMCGKWIQKLSLTGDRNGNR